MITFSVKKTGDFEYPKTEKKNDSRTLSIKADINGEKATLYFQNRGWSDNRHLEISHVVINGKTKTKHDYSEFGIELDPVSIKTLCDEGLEFLTVIEEEERKERKEKAINELKVHPLFMIVMPELEKRGFKASHPKFEDIAFPRDPRLMVTKDGIEVHIFIDRSFWKARSGGHSNRVEKKFKKILEAPAKVEIVHTEMMAMRAHKTNQNEGLKGLGKAAAAALSFPVKVEVKNEYVRDPYSKKGRDVTVVRLTDNKGRVFTPHRDKDKITVKLHGNLILSPEKMAKVISILNED